MLRPFFTYYGGKYRIAPRYPAPTHSLLYEPFAGSAGYSLRHFEKKVRLFDLNERVCGVWDYIFKVKELEILKLPEIFDDCRDLKVPQEAKWLIGFWCNKGSAEPRNKPSTWMRSGVRLNSYWGPAIKQRIASQLSKVRHWTIHNSSFDRIGNIAASWFIDPPYASDAGRQYTYNEINYSALAEFCRSRRGQVIVCESVGADWLPFKPFHVAKGLEGPKGKKKIHEAIWTHQDTMG